MVKEHSCDAAKSTVFATSQRCKAYLFLPHPASLSGPWGSSQSCTLLKRYEQRNGALDLLWRHRIHHPEANMHADEHVRWRCLNHGRGDAVDGDVLAERGVVLASDCACMRLQPICTAQGAHDLSEVDHSRLDSYKTVH